MKSGPMITRLAIAVSVTLFLMSGIRLFAEAHPHPPIQRLPQVTTTSPQSTPAQQVTTADISAGIKRHLASTRKRSSDKKFHINYQGKDLALDLVRVHDDQLSVCSGPAGRDHNAVSTHVNRSAGWRREIDTGMEATPAGTVRGVDSQN